MSSSCPHCDKLYGELKQHHYAVQWIMTDDSELRTSLDQGIPLIMCSCSDCQVPSEVAQLLSNSSIPDNWNILQLHQAIAGSVKLPTMQSNNERLKVTHIDKENRISVSEVLEWLDAKILPSPLWINKVH